MTYIVSACLLGVACRYDGQSKGCESVQSLADEHEVIPFCPEAPILGTPRGRISVIETSEGERLRRDADGMDVTDAIMQYVQQFVAEYPEAQKAILKSKSPSCGLGSTPILDESLQQIGLGDGLAARYLMKAGISCCDEFNINNKE